jgi:hypothetical protein
VSEAFLFVMEQKSLVISPQGFVIEQKSIEVRTSEVRHLT